MSTQVLLDPIINDLETIYLDLVDQRNQLPDSTTPSYWLLTGKMEGISGVISALKIKRVKLRLAATGKLQ